MVQDPVHEDIAFIRAAIEQGRNYATGRSPDMVVWGIAAALGYLHTYAFVRGWSRLDPNWLWAVCIGLPWLYSLRRPLRRLAGDWRPAGQSPMVVALRMTWLGCGVCLTILALAACWTGDIRQGWFNAVVAGVLGAAMFATSFLANLPWLRWIAVLWWAGELLLFTLRGQPEAPLVAAVLMLLLLAGPGLVLMRRRTPDPT
jgi:hypothetical protein